MHCKCSPAPKYRNNPAPVLANARVRKILARRRSASPKCRAAHALHVLGSAKMWGEIAMRLVRNAQGQEKHHAWQVFASADVWRKSALGKVASAKVQETHRIAAARQRQSTGKAPALQALASARAQEQPRAAAREAAHRATHPAPRRRRTAPASQRPNARLERARTTWPPRPIAAKAPGGPASSPDARAPPRPRRPIPESLQRACSVAFRSTVARVAFFEACRCGIAAG